MFFSRDCRVSIFTDFVIDKFGYIVFFSKAWDKFFFMLPDSFLEVARDAGVQSGVVLIGHDVNAELFFLHENMGLLRPPTLGRSPRND